MLLRSLRAVFWFMVGVALVAVPMFARSESQPAVVGWKYNTAGQCSTAAAAQALYVSSHTGPYQGYNYFFTGTYSNESTGAYGGTYYSCNQSTGQCGTSVGWSAQALSCSSCPSSGGWTLSGTTCTRPDCAAGETRQEDGTCRASCPASGAAYSSGLYDMGTNALAGPLRLGCVGGCNVVFNGEYPSASSIVAGTTHYYAKGGYYYMGPESTCTGGDGVPASTATPPSDTCAAGQGKATMNGKTVCIDGTGTPVNTQAPTTTTKTTTTTTNTTNGDGTTSSTNTGTTSSTTCTGDSCTTTTTTTTGGGSGAGGTTTTGTTTEGKSDFCAKNPKDAQCTGSGTSEDTEEEEEITPGDGAGTDELYTKGDRTAAQVFTDFGNKVKGAGFFSAASSFFTVSVPGGACTDLSGSFDVGWGHSFTVDMTSVFCGGVAQAMYGVLSIGVMLAAMWVAFKIALL